MSLTSTELSVCPLCVLRQVSDLVLIDPIPEDIFEENQWKEYWWVYICFQEVSKGHDWEKGREEEECGKSRGEKIEMLKDQKPREGCEKRIGKEDWEEQGKEQRGG